MERELLSLLKHLRSFATSYVVTRLKYSLTITTNDPKVEKPIPTQLELSEVFATNNDIPADAFPLPFES
jgi:hypothetical protein